MTQAMFLILQTPTYLEHLYLFPIYYNSRQIFSSFFKVSKNMSLLLPMKFARARKRLSLLTTATSSLTATLVASNVSKIWVRILSSRAEFSVPFTMKSSENEAVLFSSSEDSGSFFSQMIEVPILASK